MKNKRGVIIDFGNMSFGKRISIWWTFTLGCLFKKEVKTKYKVKMIHIIK